MGLARKGVLLAIVVLLVLLVAAGAALAAKPTKVVIITMDQMKPWYAEQFDMDNILWLQNHGANFKNATVGQMASETVVSHNTIVSGQFPKHMGWSDEVMRDTDNVLGYGAGAIVTVGDLTYDQFTLSSIEAEGYPKLGDYMHAKFPGKIVANFGGKYYQVASTAASSSDIWVTYRQQEARRRPPVPEPSSRGPARTAARPAATCPLHRRRRPLQDQHRQRPLDRQPVSGAERLLRHQDRQAGLPVSRGRSHGPGSVRDQPERRRLGGRRGHQGHRERGLVWRCTSTSAASTRSATCGAAAPSTRSPTTTGIPARSWRRSTCRGSPRTPTTRSAGSSQALKAEGDWSSTLFIVLADHGSTWAKSAHYVDAAGGGNLSWYYDPNDGRQNTDLRPTSAPTTRPSWRR